jgi:hypothetical protein
MNDSVARTEPADGIPDVTAFPLGRLLRDGESVLDNALRRWLAHRDGERWSAFGNVSADPDEQDERYAAFESTL